MSKGFSVGLYRDYGTGRSRWAVFSVASSAWYFPTSYGRAAAVRLAAKLNRGAV